MSRMLKGAIAGAIALGGLAALPGEASAMPVAGMGQIAGAPTTDGADLHNVYWRRYWHRPYVRVWRRYPYWGWRRHWGWRRPIYGHPYRRFYRW